MDALDEVSGIFNVSHRTESPSRISPPVSAIPRCSSSAASRSRGSALCSLSNTAKGRKSGPTASLHSDQAIIRFRNKSGTNSPNGTAIPRTSAVCCLTKISRRPIRKFALSPSPLMKPQEARPSATFSPTKTATVFSSLMPNYLRAWLARSCNKPQRPPRAKAGVGSKSIPMRITARSPSSDASPVNPSLCPQTRSQTQGASEGTGYLTEQLDDHEEETEECERAYDRIQQIETDLEEIENNRSVSYPESVKQSCGVIVSLDSSGQARDASRFAPQGGRSRN